MFNHVTLASNHFELQKVGTINSMEIDTGMQNLSPLGHQFKFSKPVTKNCYHMKVVCELSGI